MTRSTWDPPPPSSSSSSVTSSPARASAGSDALLMIDADKGEAAPAVIEDLRARLAAAEERLSALEKSTTKATAMTTTTTTKDERAVDRPRTRWEETQELIRLGHEKSLLAYCRNSKVNTATGRILPIYSNVTGKEIELCPKSFEELKNMGNSHLKLLLKAFRVEPLDRTDEEMREVVRNKMGLSGHCYNLLYRVEEPDEQDKE